MFSQCWEKMAVISKATSVAWPVSDGVTDGNWTFLSRDCAFRELEKFLSEHRLGGTAGTALETWSFGVSSATEVRHKPFALIH